MDRDRRLTGFLRGQSDRPEAPAGFELNNPWRVRYHSVPAKRKNHTKLYAARKAVYVDTYSIVVLSLDAVRPWPVTLPD